MEVDGFPVRVVSRPERPAVLVELQKLEESVSAPSPALRRLETQRTSSENTSSYFSPSSPVRV